MVVLAGIALAALMIGVLVALVERSRAAEGIAHAGTALERARRRSRAHAAWLRDLARAADDLQRDAAADGGPADQNSPPTAPV